MDTFSWPCRGLPRVDRAGHWPLDDRDFEHAYLSPTHAFHLYDYAAEIRIGRLAVQVQPGDATLTPAGVESRYHLARPGRHWCVHFYPVAESGLELSLPVHLHLGALRHRTVESVRRIAAALGDRHTPVGPVAAATASAGMLALLLDLASVGDARRSQSTDALAKAAALIDERLGEPLEVAALARSVGLTQDYLARRFRVRHGTTLHGWQLMRRIDHAQQLLSSTDIPIGRIAERLGFSDAQHFNKSFRRLVGASPSEFRTSKSGRARS